MAAAQGRQGPGFGLAPVVVAALVAVLEDARAAGQGRLHRLVEGLPAQIGGSDGVEAAQRFHCSGRQRQGSRWVCPPRRLWASAWWVKAWPSATASSRSRPWARWAVMALARVQPEP